MSVGVPDSSNLEGECLGVGERGERWKHNIYGHIFNDIKRSSTESSYNCSKGQEGWVVSDLHRNYALGLVVKPLTLPLGFLLSSRGCVGF